MRLRFVLLLAVASVACSSEEPAPATGGIDKCTASGGQCAQNFPFLCSPGFAEVTDEARKTACGTSVGEDPRPVKCCIRSVVVPTDTGTGDTASTDATSSDATSTDATSTDATSTDATSTDATSTDATSTDVATGG